MRRVGFIGARVFDRIVGGVRIVLGLSRHR